ncbi:hypothetical protein AURANDRAFT_68716 [Aureococcus anophagefferens]|uniref:DEAD-box helicase OB fold domain-containing protein n=1 Tax=Aureococcus anophagefferens TaxID=44056 RepID=F0YQJ2_AURAN|nr:hypothetical protein AURANDRAFT_68716 [Aureococcus anophagefferens]EGB02617.1 hypothetical protein AURANDRAFT_68716 [Aureococcus anophagefferens]|eukprot:XP_009042684.1 hypothetical protein AURANDRAFT_68716 [Aureococcus anophagefferens]
MYRGRGGQGGGRGGKGGGYGKGRGGGGKGGGGKGGGGKGGKGGGGYNWRQHVEPSTDPDIVNPCRARVAAFLASGAPRLEMAQRLRNVENNTMRAVAQDMGVGWVRGPNKGDAYALVRVDASLDSGAQITTIAQLVRSECERGGGKCARKRVWERMSSELQAFSQTSLKCRMLRRLEEQPAARAALDDVRCRATRKGFCLEGFEDEEDALFDCFDVALTVAAGLGSKSPFVCPLGKEPLANAAKARLADGTDSDHVLLERAYAEWRARPGYRDRRSFCDRFFLSHQTLEYVDQLRRDLGSGCRDLLKRDAGGRARPRHAAARLSSALLAALWPNVAAVRKQGKGLALGSGLKVVCHPGSVNRSAADRLVVFYDVQETSDRYLYDTSVVSLAQVLLFAPDVAQSTTNSGRAKLAVAPDLQVLVDAAALDDVLATRDLLQAFVQRSVGRPTDDASARASAALAALFSADTLALHGKRAKKVDREEAWQRKKAAEAAAKIRRAGRATDLIPAAVTLGATQIEEDHRHEQFFYDEPTSRRMLALVDGYETPLLVCNPSLAARRDAAGGDYLLLDRDERFASLKFRAFDLRAPEPVDYAFDALFLDPPFANVGVAELAAATRTLMGAAPRPLYVGYNAKRAAELEAAFAEFA